MDNTPLSITPADTRESIYRSCVKRKNHIAKVRIRTKHDNFTFLEKMEKYY